MSFLISNLLIFKPMVLPFFIWVGFLDTYSIATLFLIFELVCVIGIESYVIRRSLKRSYSFVVPRMIVINMVEVIVQLALMFCCVLLIQYVYLWWFKYAYYGRILNLQEMSPILDSTYPWEPADRIVRYGFRRRCIFNEVGGIMMLLSMILFVVRLLISRIMFSWFDPSIKIRKLAKAVISANWASYRFLYLMALSRVLMDIYDLLEPILF